MIYIVILLALIALGASSTTPIPDEVDVHVLSEHESPTAPYVPRRHRRTRQRMRIFDSVEDMHNALLDAEVIRQSVVLLFVFLMILAGFRNEIYNYAITRGWATRGP